jgi:hypothetical protein
MWQLQQNADRLTDTFAHTQKQHATKVCRRPVHALAISYCDVPIVAESDNHLREKLGRAGRREGRETPHGHAGEWMITLQ